MEKIEWTSCEELLEDLFGVCDPLLKDAVIICLDGK